MTQRIEVSGVGLHSGAPVRVELLARSGPVRLLSATAEATLEQLEVVSTARATTVGTRDGRLRIATVEHVFAAMAGLGIHEGVQLRVDGPEVPLLDGGALRWCEALRDLSVPPSPPRLRVVREAVLEVGPTRFELRPDDRMHVEVRVELDDPRFVPDASWAGDALDFERRIAPARTFTLARDVEELIRRGLARHVDPTSVVVLAPDAVHSAGRPFTPDEPARHKLLDLMGDLFLHGGPPRGHVRVVRPGHASNARLLRRALDEGILATA